MVGGGMRMNQRICLLLGVVLTSVGMWSGAALAQVIVPGYVPLSELGSLNPIVEFNTDFHLSLDERRWLFQNGKRVTFEQVNFADSHCYLGTNGDMYEAKTYKKGYQAKGLELVTEVGNEIYLVDRTFDANPERRNREDLYVIGCEARRDGNRVYVPEAKAQLSVADLYRHMAYNVVLKSNYAMGSAAVQNVLQGQMAAAKQITIPEPFFSPTIRKIIFNKPFLFEYRRPQGWDRTRYTFQDGKLHEDYLDLKGLKRNEVFCNFRFNHALPYNLRYASDLTFVPVKMYKVKNGVVFDQERPKNSERIRSMRCERADGLPITFEDILQAFGKELISIQI